MKTNPLQLPFVTLPVQLAAQGWIAAETLAEPIAVNQALADARERLLELDGQAQLVMAAAEEAAARLKAEARDAVQREFDELRQQVRDDAIADAVQWLCKEAELESAIAARMTHRWRKLTARVLEELLGKSDQTELFLHHVERKVSSMLAGGRVQLHVALGVEGVTSKTFAHLTDVQVLPDESLTRGQAVLDNGLVRIHLDFPAHQSWLLEQLQGGVMEKRYA